MKEEIQTKLLELLEKAIELEKADKGNIQLYNTSTQELIIVAQKGFDTNFLEHFKSVKPFDSSSCGRAIGIGGTILINDVETDVAFNRSNGNIAKSAGFRAVKSVSIFSKTQECLGIISTHFKEPKRHWDAHKLETILPNLAFLLEANALRFCHQQ